MILRAGCIFKFTFDRYPGIAGQKSRNLVLSFCEISV